VAYFYSYHQYLHRVCDNDSYCKSFGKSTGFGIGLVFLGFIFFPMLGFGDATYIGPNGVNIMSDEIDSIRT
jgi:hypothetical protein